jgi:hypothetical protein
MDYDDLLVCMGLVNSCNGALGNPCLSGTLAVISDNPQTLNQTNIQTAQFGCVNGTACDCGTVAVYDTNYGGIVCMELPEALVFTTPPVLPSATVNTPYTATIAASGGTPPYRFSSTTFPDNLILSDTGQITGTPATFGTFPVNVTVVDNMGNSAVQTFTITVSV